MNLRISAVPLKSLEESTMGPERRNFLEESGVGKYLKFLMEWNFLSGKPAVTFVEGVCI